MIFAITDIETTGGSPKNSKITEIAIYKCDGEKILDEYTTLVDPEIPIPKFITQLTGINDEMVEGAPKFYEIAKDIIEFLKDTIFVAHNVGFDYGVLRGEYKSLGYDFRFPHMCTVRASRIVLPGHESYSLGKLTRELGIELIGRHRAAGDALATAELFKLLYAKDPNNLETFITSEINPTVLHPNLDLSKLDDIPNKTGVYRFYDDTNKLIYIGKSKHILTRIKQHLKNSKTKRAIEMRQNIARIEFELTGSECISLLYESALIKQYKPIYNRALRRSNFSHGLFTYTDNAGYMNLYVETLNKKKDQPITTFTSKADSKKFLEEIAGKHVLCQKLLGIYPTQHACFSYHTKQCFGACIQKEPNYTYNARVNSFIKSMSFDDENFFIIEKGRKKGENSIILIEKGVYVGYGYIPFFQMSKGIEVWKEAIEHQVEDRDARTILRFYMRKNKDLNIRHF